MIIWKLCTSKKLQAIFSSDCRNKILECYDWRKNFFDYPVKDDLITYETIRNIATGQGEDYTTGCMLDYNYFKNYYKMITTDLSKQQALDTESN